MQTDNVRVRGWSTDDAVESHLLPFNAQLSKDTRQTFFENAVDGGEYERYMEAATKVKCEESTCEDSPEQGEVILGIFRENPSYGLRNVDMYVAAKAKAWFTDLGTSALIMKAEQKSQEGQPGLLQDPDEAVSFWNQGRVSASVFLLFC